MMLFDECDSVLQIHQCLAIETDFKRLLSVSFSWETILLTTNAFPHVMISPSAQLSLLFSLSEVFVMQMLTCTTWLHAHIAKKSGFSRRNLAFQGEIWLCKSGFCNASSRITKNGFLVYIMIIKSPENTTVTWPLTVSAC